jgi:hypothetical protein
MHNRQALILVTSVFAFAACNPFHREPVSEVSRDVNLNTRWRATLVSPAALAGAVQIKGTASMQPGRNSEETTVSLSISNATPGGVHPWQAHRGQCGADEGVFGSAAAYKTLKIGDDGRAEASAGVPMGTPESGNYFVTVAASAANPDVVVACGNLAPPVHEPQPVTAV